MSFRGHSAKIYVHGWLDQQLPDLRIAYCCPLAWLLM